MKFLANENVPLASIRLLRETGHRIDAIIEDSPGIKDEDVLHRSAIEKSILLTFDRDYGELIFKRNLPPPAGIIFFRFTPKTSLETAHYLLELLEVPGLDFEGRFTTVKRDSVRQRLLS